MLEVNAAEDRAPNEDDLWTMLEEDSRKKGKQKGKVCGKWLKWFCMYVIHLAPESADLASLLPFLQSLSIL